ncbi:MAG: ribonuclease R [Phycisphaerae bacterium]
MPERYTQAILKYLSDQSHQPLKPKQLARQLGVADEDYSTFRTAIKQLRDSGRIVLGSSNAVTLPTIGKKVVGVYKANPRGFGFITPDEPNSHGDLFVPEGESYGAMTGDRVKATVHRRGKRGGEINYTGRIVEVLQRAQNRYVGTLCKAQGEAWFVLPDGKQVVPPITIQDVGPQAHEGTKVVVEITHYAKHGGFPSGVIVETLGDGGQPEVETMAVIYSRGIPFEFKTDVLEEARQAVHSFDAEDPEQVALREDLTDMTIITIDPPDARDYDDAISLEAHDNGQMTLGVHIADVSHFVQEGGPLDTEAKTRATSVYFPRKVLPMLPEVLSNGVCSLQEGVKRFAKSAFITYNADAEVVDTRFCESIISSSKRLTYEQAQSIIDGKTAGFEAPIVELLHDMNDLAKKIETRRYEQGMLHLELPEVELIFDRDNHVVGAEPEDDAYTHTIIEMFMVEANEAVARLMKGLDRHILRRVHPAPDATAAKQLASFVRASGHKIPSDLNHKQLQQLLEDVKGEPESYAINLAVLKTFQAAEYSPMNIGHFALASEDYCHFTSPIRRYPDLTVHRMFAEHCRGRLEQIPKDDLSELVALGERCTELSKRAESAENEVREVLVLLYLQQRVGETFKGVVTGVTNFGVFVQLEDILTDGLMRMQDLGDDWWVLDARYGRIRGERTGRTFRIGDELKVKLSRVDVAKRQMDLIPDQAQKKSDTGEGKGRKRRSKGKEGGGGKGQPQGKKGKKGKSRRKGRPRRNHGRGEQGRW